MFDRGSELTESIAQRSSPAKAMQIQDQRQPGPNQRRAAQQEIPPARELMKSDNAAMRP